MSVDPESILQQWISAALPELTEVIYSRQKWTDVPRPPALPYAYVYHESDRPVTTTPVTVTTDTPGSVDPQKTVQKVSQAYAGAIVVGIFGDGSSALLRKLVRSLAAPETKDPAPPRKVLDDNKFAVHLLAQVTDQTAERDTTWERAAGATFSVQWVEVDEYEVPWVQTVETPLSEGA